MGSVTDAKTFLNKDGGYSPGTNHASHGTSGNEGVKAYSKGF